jgi:DNA-binding GntR family transcriptional regulator
MTESEGVLHLITVPIDMKPDTSDGNLSAAQERFRTIYRTIRDRIALLDYLPEERLSEGDLADEFGVSRTPVRRVLIRLETEGLLESRHGVGTFVTSLDMDEIRDVYLLRKELVELMGTLDPIPPTPKLLDKMRETQQSCLLVAEAKNPKKAFARANIDFSEHLMALIGNKPLRRTLELLFYQTARMWLALTSNELIIREAGTFHDEIGAMIRFLEAGDVDAAAHLRRGHISLAFARLEKYRADADKTSGQIPD